MKNGSLFRIGAALLLVICLLVPVSAFAQGPQAHIRIVHAASDAPAVDVYLNGKLAARDVAFSKATPYTAVNPGNYRVQVTPTGADLSQAVLDTNVTLRPNTDYTAAATGQKTQLKLLVLTDAKAGPARGQARLRVVHASPDAPAVDVALVGGRVLLPRLSPGTASRYVPVQPGTVNLEVRVSGTTDVALRVMGLQTEPGKAYTVFVLGEVADGSVHPLALTDGTSR